MCGWAHDLEHVVLKRFCRIRETNLDKPNRDKNSNATSIRTGRIVVLQTLPFRLLLHVHLVYWKYPYCAELHHQTRICVDLNELVLGRERTHSQFLQHRSVPS